MSPLLSRARLDTLLTPPRVDEVDLATLLAALHARSYTGSVTLHFHQGQPRTVEFDAPQLRLATPSPTSA